MVGWMDITVRMHIVLQRLDASNRAKLLQGHQSLQRASESIARSHQIAAETDQIGVEIIDELGTQRETLLRTKEKVCVLNILRICWRKRLNYDHTCQYVCVQFAMLEFTVEDSKVPKRND